MTTQTNQAPNGREKVAVELVGQDGNAFAVMARCSQSMKRAGWGEDEIKAFRHACMSQHSYDDLLMVVLSYCEDEQDDDEDEEDNFDDEDMDE